GTPRRGKSSKGCEGTKERFIPWLLVRSASACSRATPQESPSSGTPNQGTRFTSSAAIPRQSRSWHFPRIARPWPRRVGIKLWNADTGKEIATFKGHSNAVLNMMFSADGRTLVSSGGQWGDRVPGEQVTTSTEVIFWDVATGKVITTLGGHTDRI